MFRIILVVGLLMVFGVGADELITMDNGMTCWRNNVGVTYGCSGGVDTGSSGFNDVKTGRRYESIGGDNAIDTSTGHILNLPSYDYNNDYEDEN